ncbi:MAG: MFS transporter [Trueperaceae bacterium]|nr:MAG: MFS transporter [Trueperaceae bacterium]
MEPSVPDKTEMPDDANGSRSPKTPQNMPPPDEEFHGEQVLTIAGGHFVHDTYSAFIPPLLPLLQERLGASYALTGGLVVFTQLPSLLNPLIGYLADKVSLRYFVILAPAVSATLISCLGLTSDYLALAFLLLAAGVSIAAFHAPAPAMIARISGRRLGTGMSLFMAAGELGRTLGPIVAVAGVGWFGLEGIWRLAFVGWLVSGILYLRLRRVSARPGINAATQLPWRKARRLFGTLGWLLIPRIFIVVCLTTFLPLFMSDTRGSGLWLAAASLTILEAAGVVGALMTGTLSDRLGRPQVLLVLLGLSPVFLFAFVYAPGWLTVPLLIALGLTAISPTPVFLAIIQDEFPDNRALANGSFMALNFLVRALGIWLVGVLADRIGLQSTFVLAGVSAFLSIPAIWFLPRSGASGRSA